LTLSGGVGKAWISLDSLRDYNLDKAEDDMEYGSRQAGAWVGEDAIVTSRSALRRAVVDEIEAFFDASLEEWSRPSEFDLS
jgi:hypothetical protein